MPHNCTGEAQCGQTPGAPPTAAREGPHGEDKWNAPTCPRQSESPSRPPSAKSSDSGKERSLKRYKLITYKTANIYSTLKKFF